MAVVHPCPAKVKVRNKKPDLWYGVSKYVISRIKSLTSETASHLVAISLNKHEIDRLRLVEPLT